uniref:Uncharacterized protein n=1 Tax=Sphaerodactylus townsendi TaxID=933632 RepID=A0ACB8FMH2_9SAUR
MDPLAFGTFTMNSHTKSITTGSTTETHIRGFNADIVLQPLPLCLLTQCLAAMLAIAISTSLPWGFPEIHTRVCLIPLWIKIHEQQNLGNYFLTCKGNIIRT